jgi:dihydrofolate reductase
MGKVMVDISISLDGFVAGPNPSLENPLGEGGEQLHEWVVALEAWRKVHGLEGGETTASSELVEESLASTGAYLMGRKMFSGGEGPWEDDPNFGGWWGEDLPFVGPVFVLTHHPREPLASKGKTMTFVTGGLDTALAQAREAAGEKNVAVAGGADVIQQVLAADELDELQVNVAPVLLGGGTRLFDGGAQQAVELVRVVDAPGVTHLKYRVAR